MTEENEDKSVFDLSSGEEASRLKPVTEKVRADLFARGLPVTYQDGRCPSANHFIQEISDGRLHLVLFDLDKYEYEFLKAIPEGPPGNHRS